MSASLSLAGVLLARRSDLRLRSSTPPLMARHALWLLLALAAGYGSALVATPVLRRHPRPAHSTRHAVCCSEPLEAALEGWVASRRILGSAMAFIDVHASPDDVEQPAHRDVAQREVARPEPVQVLLPRQ